MKFKYLSKKKIFVVGLGISGFSLAMKFKKDKIIYYCWDDNEKVRAICLKKQLNIVPPEEINFKKIDFLILSPGIPNNHKSAIIAKKYSCKIISDIELLHYVNNKSVLIGITGTNGKSTTTKLIEQTIKIKNKNTYSAGNIGIPLSDLELRRTISSNLIIEASSFQLDRIIDLKFNIAVLLNITNDHIDRHQGLDNYIKAKLNIFKNQIKTDYSIICIDDKNCFKIARNFSRDFDSTLITISTNSNLKSDYFIEENNSEIVITDNIKKNDFRFSRNQSKLKGSHNLINILSCYVICLILKISNESFLSSLTKFKGLQHRFEIFKKFKNIHFINDSKSTNVESSKMALKNLKNTFWIVGGRKKPGGLRGIYKSLNQVTKAFIYGESRYDFDEYLSKYIYTEVFENLNQATEKAITVALKEKGQINILLSPASSSYDQFKNFEHRGLHFKRIIKDATK